MVKRTGRRPDGTDGSDHQFRMVVEDRYKKLADTRMQMKKLLTIQTMYYIIRGAWAAILVFQREDLAYATLAMIAIGSAAAWMGTVSMKGSRPISQRLYFGFTAAAIGLGLWPMLTGTMTAKLYDLYDEAEDTQEYTRVSLALLEAGQDLIGIATQVVALFLCASIMKLSEREKDKKFERFMDEDEKDE